MSKFSKWYHLSYFRSALSSSTLLPASSISTSAGKDLTLADFQQARRFKRAYWGQCPCGRIGAYEDPQHDSLFHLEGFFPDLSPIQYKIKNTTLSPLFNPQLLSPLSFYPAPPPSSRKRTQTQCAAQSTPLTLNPLPSSQNTSPHTSQTRPHTSPVINPRTPLPHHPNTTIPHRTRHMSKHRVCARRKQQCATSSSSSPPSSRTAPRTAASAMMAQLPC